MSYVSLIRTRAEAIVAGEYGVNRSVQSGRFTRISPQHRRVEQQPASASERHFQVVLGIPRPEMPVNTADGTKLDRLTLTVRIAYQATNAGGDWPEGLTEQHGPGDGDAIEDRAGTDANDVQYALDNYESWGTLQASPRIHVIDVRRLEEDTALIDAGDVMVAEVKFSVLVEVAQATHAP